MKKSNLLVKAAALFAALAIVSAVNAENTDPENQPRKKVPFTEQSFVNRIASQVSNARQLMKFKTIDDHDSLDKNIKDMIWLKENREPPFMPDLSEIEFQNGSEASITQMWKALKEITYYHNDILETLEKLKKEEIPRTFGAMNSIYRYLDKQTDFLSSMTTYDKGIEYCLKYSEKIPTADPIWEGDGNQMLIKAKIDDLWHTVYFNNVTVIQSQIRPFNVDPHFKDLEKRLKDYIFVFKNYKRLVNEWYGAFGAKTAAAEKFAVLQQAYVGFLDTVVSELQKMAELYDSRLDAGTVHGRIITGKIELPYGHIKLNTGEGGAVIYTNAYLKATAKCQNAYNGGWNERIAADPAVKLYVKLLK
jgi:hypothetical protein